MNLKIDRATRNWREDARCRGADAMLFFPAGSTGEAVGAIEAAKAVCGMCAVQEPCLNYAVENQETGIWGGRSEDERRALRKAWRTRRMISS